MMFLSHQLRERTGMALMASDKVVRFDQPELLQLPFAYMTGHRDFTFSEEEVANLRRYLLGGGHLWIDDSTHYRDQEFDVAVRREMKRLFPEGEIVRLGPDFGGWVTGYDLSDGYKGYAIPPGDKYRQDYIEGVLIDGRVAVVYTRNDYGDGLNIDPHTQPLKDSLTSLSPAEMQEGATRMGINLVLYFLSQRGVVDLEFVSDAAGGMRRAADPSDAQLPQGEIRKLEQTLTAESWFYEEWGDAAVMTAVSSGEFEVKFEVEEEEKAAFGLIPEPALMLRGDDVVAMRVDSKLACGARVALGFEVGEVYFETAPFYIKPGRNEAFFRCAEKNFKSAATEWEYRAELPLPANVGKLNLLIYSPDGGVMRFSEIRTIRVVP
jgi:hypothetical protein